MAGSLLLGPVLFRDFELPERIAWGGAQRLAVHELPGGRRVIDAMGRADAPIAWSGTFSGEDAAMRARLLDLMRADGGVWPLTWGRFFYSVVIQAVSVQYERATWMPYRISCVVLRDEVEGVVEDGLSLVQGVAGDLGLAGQAGLVDVSAAQSAVGMAGAGGLGSAANADAVGSVGLVRDGAEVALMAAERNVRGAGFTGFAGLSSAGDAAGALAQGAVALGFLRRAAASLATAES